MRRLTTALVFLVSTAIAATQPTLASTLDSAPAAPNAVPDVLYQSYYGGLGNAEIRAIRVNAANEVYLAGNINTGTFAVSPGGEPYGDGYDGFVAKFAADGHTPIYFTYLSTPADEEIVSMVLDAAGNAYVVGHTGDLFNSNHDAFVAKVAQNGASVVVSSSVFGRPSQATLGYDADDRATDVAVSNSGTIVVVGYTTSFTGFPLLNAYDTQLGGNRDGFIQRYDANLNLLSSSYFGGLLADGLAAVAVGGDGNITVAGSYDVGVDDNHVSVARLSSSASAIIWQVTAAGNVSEEPYDIRIDGAGDVLVVGETKSSDFVIGPAIDHVFDAPTDGFLMKVLGTSAPLSNAQRVPYCTYVGSPGLQRVTAIDLASNGDPLLTGFTQADGNYNHRNAFLLRLNASLTSVVYTTPYGSNSNADHGYGFVRAPSGALWFAGSTGGGIATTPDAFQGNDPGGDSGFFARLHDPLEDPASVQFSVAVLSVSEAAGGAALAVTRSGTGAGTATVHVATANGSAVAPGDYTSGATTLSFAVGELSKPIFVPIAHDTLDEPDESFTLLLSNPTGAVLGTPATATVTILDDDAPPVLSVDNGGCSVTEGNSGSVNCTMVYRLSAVSGRVVSFNTATANGSAIAGNDYTSHGSTARTIAAGQSTLSVSVPVLGDLLDEVDETFAVNANTMVNATPGSLSATGTIIDNDAAPTLSVDNGGCSVTEGNSGSTPCNFVLRLSSLSGKTITFNTATANGSALGGSDFTALASSARSIAAGQTTLTVVVSVLGDTVVEPDESFTLAVSSVVNATPGTLSGIGTIDNDDSALPALIFKNGLE